MVITYKINLTYMKSLFHFLSSKLNLIFISLSAIFAPIEPILWTIGVLIVCDFIFGLYKAHKLNEEITSRKMGHTISKILLYNITIITLYLFDTYIMKSGLHIEKVGAVLIGMVEIKSIDESFVLIFGWSIWDRIKKIINRGESTTKNTTQNPNNFKKSDTWDEYGD